MKDFFKYTLATIVGVIVSVILLGFVFFVGFFVLIASLGNEKPIAISSNSVLTLNLDAPIIERTPEKPLRDLLFWEESERRSIGFNDAIQALKAAANDSKIKCVYIEVSSPSAGMATMKEIRDAILEFKKSKKPVIAYSEIYTQGAYYLASAADKVYLNPQGSLEFKGLSAELTFFKGSLDKLGIEAQIIRVGNYKSAIEPFINTKMSDYNRLQITAFLNGLYKVFLGDIAKTRNISVDNLFNIADEYKIRLAKDAVNYKLVDALKYKDEVLTELKNITGKNIKSDLNIVVLYDYAKNISKENGAASQEIAVIYANGEIVDGEGSDEQIGSARISEAICKARINDNIKAIVLRVNSVGGNALASDVIWREILLSKKVKPVIASFGNVATSGGYYIACAADSIFVQPNTITGSIGVFGIIPNFQNLFTHKLGLTFDGVKTNQYADFLSINRPLTPGERLIIQKKVNHIYDSFILRIANGRKKTKVQVDNIGGGRVWVGTDAVKIGLADRLANFNDAIKAAAKKAELKTYKVVEYPKKMDPFKSLIVRGKSFLSTYFVKQELGENYQIYKNIQKTLTEKTGIQARMEYDINIK